MTTSVRVQPATEVAFNATSKGITNTRRGVVRDGEFRLLHGNGIEGLLMIEDEVVVDENGMLVAVAVRMKAPHPSRFYLAI